MGVSIGGTLTYEDVKNVDSVVTARTGIDVLAGGINAVGVVTATSFVGNLGGDVTGDLTGNVVGNVTGQLTGTAEYAAYATLAGVSTYAGTAGISTTVNYVSEWDITADAGNTYYKFAGPGFVGDEQDPDIFVIRGQKYLFRNQMGAHPFEIRTTAGVALTAAQGISGDNPVSNGEMFWNVYMNADDEYRTYNVHQQWMKNHGIMWCWKKTSVNTSGIINAALVAPL